MIDKQELQKIVKHIIKRDRGIPDKRLLHPKREWGIAVLISVVLLVCGSVWAFVQYEYFRQVGRNEFSADEKKFEYDRGDALDANEIYGKQKRLFEQLIGEIPEPLPVEVLGEETQEEVGGDFVAGEAADNEGDAAEEEVTPDVSVDDGETTASQ